MTARIIVLGVAIAAGVAGLASRGTADSASAVAYPEGFREWVHVSSTWVGPQGTSFARFVGIHHVYANAAALKGYRTGDFADGSIIVFDQLESKEQAGTTKEGARRFLNVMEKDSRRFASTGGWGFEEFTANSRTEGRLTPQAQQACFVCHQQLAKDDLVIGVISE